MAVKVLQVVGQMHHGGMETMIMNYYRNIDRQKVQFDFLVHYKEPGDFDDEIRKLGGHIYIMPRTVPYNYFIYKKALNDFFKEHHDYVAVHGNLINTAFIYHRIAKEYGIKCCITHAHSNSAQKDWKGILGSFTSKLAIKYTDKFFACSKDAAQYYFGDKIIRNNGIIIMKNAIDTNKFSFQNPIRQKVRAQLNVTDKFVIGHVGRFVKAKNHFFLLKIFKEILKLNSNAVLLLVGDGPLFDKVKEEAEKLGIFDSVKLLGNRSDVNELMQAMDVFVLPSLFEGLGIVLIEAQAAGLRCYTSANVVSKEAKVTDLLKYIDLNCSSEYWAKQIMASISGYERYCPKNNIVNSGFDIETQVKTIQDYFVGLK